MKKIKLLALSLLCALGMSAGVWDTDYPAVEASITQPTFAERTYNICKYGAKAGAEA